MDSTRFEHSFWDITPKRELQIELRTVPGFEWVSNDILITSTGFIIGARDHSTVRSIMVSRGANLMTIPDTEGKVRAINLARAVYSAYGPRPVTDSDFVVHKDGDQTNNHIDNLLLNDITQNAAWLANHEKNCARVGASHSKRVALRFPDNTWRIFASIRGAHGWLKSQGFGTAKKPNRLAENARHNTNIKNNQRHLNKSQGGIRKNHGFTAYLFDELSDANQTFINSKLTK